MSFCKAKHQQQGSVSIEFAVTILPFFVLLLALIEICRFMMMSSVIDVALAAATRVLVVESASEDLTSKLQLTLSEQNLPLLDSSKITIQARYFDTLKSLANDIDAEDFNGQDFAEFTLVYPYQALFISGQIDSFSRLTEFQRTVLVTLERSASYANKP
ncbi:pilus assembly protein [Moritella sp. 24]|uniref:TadE/TadG family type IV pilus assembly protein n=1 Tax=Moritella sp. 24 TaxID=2746230 RepID=UPI001BAD5D52|nr:TadE family protein [Moritella sp. 24]QUM77020.1 pilus assembly protein [Moritella sp. 24]